MDKMMWDMLDAVKDKWTPIGHPCLPLVLQQGVEELQTACNLLQTSKAMKMAALAHCSVPLTCRLSK
jgi:hypothetical protein